MASVHRITTSLLSVLFLLVLFSGFGYCAGTPDRPDKALFYPDEVQLSVSVEAEALALPSGGHGFVVALPEGALADTFMLSIDDMPAQGYYWPGKTEKEAILALLGKQVPNFAGLPENERNPERRALLEKQLPLAAEAARAEGDLKATQMRLNLLKKSFDTYGGQEGKNISPAEEAGRLFDLFGNEYARLQKDLLLQQKALADTKDLLARAQKELSDFDRFHGGEVVVIPYDKDGRQKLHYSYVLPASCEISYRLDARPDKGEFSVSQDVAFRQNSGFSWKNVDLYVSTVRRDKTLRPLNINPWEIRLVARPKPAAKYEMAQGNMAMMDAEVAPQAMSPQPAKLKKARAMAAAPVLQERGTYRVWSLGSRTIAHGAPVNLSLASDVYPAKFRYTLRPISSPKGFLTADIDLPNPLELPPGMAQFSVDGGVMGRQAFSFDGNKGSIFFGSDPQVTAIMKEIRQTSGEQGFFSKEQTRAWQWEITVKSTRPKPVVAVLEDPAPFSKEEIVNLIIQSTPRPEEMVNDPDDGGARIYQWTLNLNPGEPVLVKHHVQMVAPVTPDKALIPGR